MGKGVHCRNDHRQLISHILIYITTSGINKYFHVILANRMTTYQKQQGISSGEGMYGILQTLGSDEEVDTGTNSELSDDDYIDNVPDADVGLYE